MTINFEEYQEAHDQLKKFIHDKFIEKYKSCFTEDEYTCFTLSFEDFQAYLNSQPIHLIERAFQYVLPSVLRSLYEEEFKENDVKGRLTPEEVAKRFIYCYRNNTDTYEEEE